MTDNYDRQLLRKEQTEYLSALLGIKAPPEVMAAPECRRAGRSLLNKRVRILARNCPYLELTDDFNVLAEQYSNAYPGTHPDGPWADAQRFKRWLEHNKLIAKPKPGLFSLPLLLLRAPGWLPTPAVCTPDSVSNQQRPTLRQPSDQDQSRRLSPTREEY